MTADTPLTVAKIPYHSYSATTIFLMLQLVLNAAVSLRGSARVLTIVNNVLGQPHGETVLNFLTSVSQYNLSRILCHAQVIEYLSYITRQLFDGGCNTVFTNGFNQPSGKSAQTGYVFRPMTFAYRATIFMPIPIE